MNNEFKYGQTSKIWPSPFTLSLYSTFKPIQAQRKHKHLNLTHFTHCGTLPTLEWEHNLNDNINCNDNLNTIHLTQCDKNILTYCIARKIGDTYFQGKLINRGNLFLKPFLCSSFRYFADFQPLLFYNLQRIGGTKDQI